MMPIFELMVVTYASETTNCAARRRCKFWGCVLETDEE
jgi:hypothetical protein